MIVICKVNGCRKHATRKVEVLTKDGKVFCHFPVCEYHQDFGNNLLIGIGRTTKIDDGEMIL